MTNIELKQLRDSLGLTQAVFAKHIGANLRTVERWESKAGYMSFGERKYGPSKAGIELIEKAVG